MGIRVLDSGGTMPPMDVPDIRYARSGDVSIAYQAFGDGPVDLVLVRGSLSDLASVWDQPLFVRYAEGLAKFSRVLMFDKRRMGLSDRLRSTPTLESRMDDIRARGRPCFTRTRRGPSARGDRGLRGCSSRRWLRDRDAGQM